MKPPQSLNAQNPTFFHVSNTKNTKIELLTFILLPCSPHTPTIYLHHTLKSHHSHQHQQACLPCTSIKPPASPLCNYHHELITMPPTNPLRTTTTALLPNHHERSPCKHHIPPPNLTALALC